MRPINFECLFSLLVGLGRLSPSCIDDSSGRVGKRRRPSARIGSWTTTRLTTPGDLNAHITCGTSTFSGLLRRRVSTMLGTSVISKRSPHLGLGHVRLDLLGRLGSVRHGTWNNWMTVISKSSRPLFFLTFPHSYRP